MERQYPRDRDGLIAQLGDADPGTRRWAARDLGRHPDAVPALAARLSVEAAPAVREAILDALLAIGSDEAVEELLVFLRSEDAALRNGAVAVLQQLPDPVSRHMQDLLADVDPDVRIMAIDILQTLPHPEAPSGSPTCSSASGRSTSSAPPSTGWRRSAPTTCCRCWTRCAIVSPTSPTSSSRSTPSSAASAVARASPRAGRRRADIAEPELSVDDFEKFRDFFYRKTGIYFDESKRYFVDKRVLQRMEETENKTFREYFSFMRFQASQQEYQQVVNLMTVNETYFFREEYQLKCMVGPVLDEIVRRSRGGGPVRILSIPCSTGEEPYSIALYLIEFWPKIADVDVQIYGADIDTNVLAQCKAGVFFQPLGPVPAQGHPRQAFPAADAGALPHLHRHPRLRRVHPREPRRPAADDCGCATST